MQPPGGSGMAEWDGKEHQAEENKGEGKKMAEYSYYHTVTYYHPLRLNTELLHQYS